MLKKACLLVLPFAFSLSVLSQTSSHGLKMASETKACKKCLDAANNRPSDVELTLINEEDGLIYLYISDIKYFEKLFSRRKDGFVIDVISGSKYSCDTKAEKTTEIFKGVVSKPMYLKKIKKAGVKSADGDINIPVGPFPTSVGKDYEMNLGIIRRKKLCKIITFYSTPKEKWDILEMSSLIDTIKLDTGQANAIRSTFMKHDSKTLTFSIPFERNKYSYKSSDIEPLLNKIVNSDQKVKRIILKSYSSVEGTTELNLNLGKKRAESIIAAIQLLKGGEITISPDVQVTENWDEFYNEIEGSSLAYLANLDHSAVKR